MKQIVVLLIVTCSAILAGILPSKKHVLILFESTGYYFIFASFFLWVVYLLKLNFVKLKSTLLNHYDGLILSALLVVLIFCIAPPKFKVLADETNLIGTSMAMYQSKKASLPLSGFNLDYRRPDYQSTVDKRPLLFPLLVSLVHSLRGYSAYNGFVVNFVLGIMVLFVFYLFIYHNFSRIYALYSILIVASLPSFVIWVTSAGFETLNLFFIIFILFLFNRVTETKNIQYAELLFLSLLLVSQSRYESVVFTVAILFLLPLLLKRDSITQFSIVTYLIPILFIPTIWQPRLYAALPDINRVYSRFIQAASLYDAFSLSNLIANTPKNLMVFLGFDPNLGFSPIATVMSIAGIYLLAKKLLTDFPHTSYAFRSMLFFGLTSIGLMYLIQASFYRGDFTVFTQNRFALSYLPYIVLPVILFIKHLLKTETITKKIFVSVFLTFHLLLFWSYGSQQLLVNAGTIPYEYNKTLDYLKHHFKKNTNLLIVCERPNLYIVHFQGAVDFNYANQNEDKIRTQYQREYDQIIVLQKCRYDTREPLQSNRLINSYPLVHLRNLNLTQAEYLKISKMAAEF